MRVLYFHQYFSTPGGAAGTRSYEMAVRLIERGHSVTMVCGSSERSVSGLASPFRWGFRNGIVDGINVIEIQLNYSNKHGFARRTVSFLSFAFRSVVVALFNKADVVFATSTPLTVGIPGIIARWIRQRRFVFEVRDLWPELPAAMGIITNRFVLGLMSVLEILIYKSAHKLIGLSPGIVDGIVRRNISPSIVSLIPNGCDVSLFGCTDNRWRPPKVEDGDFLAVFAGAHGFANGLDSILDAAAELRAEGQNEIKFVLVGTGSIKARLIDRAHKERLENVVFLEPVSKLRLAGLFSAADIGLQVLRNIPAFYYGTSPNKFFDYLAAGLPVLVNYPGWVADIVTENECGFVCRPDDPSDFAGALCAAHVDRMALSKMGDRSSNVAVNMFDRNSLAKTFIDVLESDAGTDEKSL